MLTPNIQAMLRMVSAPERQGRNFGILASVLGGGAAAGPLVGGLVISLAGWEAVFLVNIPIVALVLAVVARNLRVQGPASSSGESGGPPPADRIFNRSFTGAFVSQAATTLAQYVLLLIVPLVLDDRGWSSAEIGLALTGFTIGMIILGPVGGRFGDQRGRRMPAAIGLATSAGAMVVVAVGGPSIHSGVLIASIAVFGVGFGFATPSLMTAALESVPEGRTATAGGIFQTARYTGSIPASIFFALLIGEGISGVGTVLTIAAVAAVAAIAATVVLPSARE